MTSALWVTRTPSEPPASLPSITRSLLPTAKPARRGDEHRCGLLQEEEVSSRNPLIHERFHTPLSCEWCGEESLRPSIPLLLGRRPSGPRLPGADPSRPAGSTCACHLSGLPKPPVFFKWPSSLSRHRYASDCPLRKNSRARALASSQRSSFVRLSSCTSPIRGISSADLLLPGFLVD